MDCKLILSFLSSVLLIFISLGSAAQSKSEVPLPGSLAVWMDAESRLNDKTGFNIPSRDNSALNKLFRAENADWFTVFSYWIPEAELNVAEISEEIPEDLRPELIRTRHGLREFRLFAHPESASFYKPLTKKYPRAEDALARATASSRTVLMTFPNHSNLLFFAKLSLDVNLGNVVRTIPMGESMRSIGVTKYILKTSKKIKENFKFLPEVLGFVPKGWPRGGQIIRPVPLEVLRGETTLIPMFSLTKLDGGTTILEKMIRQSGQDPQTFVLNSVVRPFVQGWVAWAVEGGLAMEDHGQNVLIEIGKSGLPTGQFYKRDMGGMNLDLSSPFFPKELLAELPFVSTVQQDYHQEFRAEARKTSMAVYFHDRVLYNIDRDLKRIQASYTVGAILKNLWFELQKEIIKETGLSESQVSISKLKTNMDQVLAAAIDARWKIEASRSCQRIFGI